MDKQTIEALAHGLSGSTGGVLAMALLYPLDNIRTRLQVQVHKTKRPHAHATVPLATITATNVSGAALITSSSPSSSSTAAISTSTISPSAAAVSSSSSSSSSVSSSSSMSSVTMSPQPQRRAHIDSNNSSDDDIDSSNGDTLVNSSLLSTSGTSGIAAGTTGSHLWSSHEFVHVHDTTSASMTSSSLSSSSLLATPSSSLLLPSSERVTEKGEAVGLRNRSPPSSSSSSTTTTTIVDTSAVATSMTLPAAAVASPSSSIIAPLPLTISLSTSPSPPPIIAFGHASSPLPLGSSPLLSPSAAHHHYPYAEARIEDIYLGTIDCARKVIAREGVQGLYTGLSSALWGVGMSSMIYFFWYDWFKNITLRRTAKKNLDPITNIVIASLAGSVNCIITNPIWVVNTRMKLHPGSMIQSARAILDHEGWRGLFRGLVPSLVLVSNPAIQFAAYEQMVRIMTNRQRRLLPAGAPIQLSVMQYFVYGAIAKALATVATYPYQVVKSRLQASHDRTGRVTTFSIIRDMWKTEGWRSFWAGMNTKLWQTVLNAAFMFVVYEKMVRLFLRLLRVDRLPAHA